MVFQKYKVYLYYIIVICNMGSSIYHTRTFYKLWIFNGLILISRIFKSLFPQYISKNYHHGSVTLLVSTQCKITQKHVRI